MIPHRGTIAIAMPFVRLGLGTLLLAVVQFQHSNIGLPEKLDRIIRWVFVIPALHKVHHSVRRHQADSNYNSLFSWWDRLFHTWLLMPPAERPQKYGVKD